MVLVFLDSPYGKDLAAPALTAPEGFALLDERRYGAAKLVFLRFGGG